MAMTTPERKIEDALLKKLRDLKYEYRPDIRDRATLEQNFREKFEALNRVRLTDPEFARLLDEIVTPDVFTAARTLRERNSFTRDDGTPLNYSFNESCIYGAITAGSDQIGTIERLNNNFGRAVYYLLYNPHEIPFAVSYPLKKRTRVNELTIGCRVYDADHVHTALSGLSAGESPTFEMIRRAGGASDWPLETWAADLLLTCKVGRQFDDAQDSDVGYFLERRSGPIGAALAVSITLPEGG
jgi:hypothetical protein